MNALDKFDLRVRPGMRVSGNNQSARDTERLLYLIQREYERAVAALAIFDLRRVSRGGKYELLLNEIAAREFVLSLDAITNLVAHLKRLRPPAVVRVLANSYQGTYGDLAHIRDSFIHIEDRGRGRDRKNKPLATRMTIINCFRNRVWEFTGADGKKYTVEISERTLLPVRDILQQIIDSYS